jgi:hypothetical protein
MIKRKVTKLPPARWERYLRDAGEVEENYINLRGLLLPIEVYNFLHELDAEQKDYLAERLHIAAGRDRREKESLRSE